MTRQRNHTRIGFIAVVAVLALAVVGSGAATAISSSEIAIGDQSPAEIDGATEGQLYNSSATISLAPISDGDIDPSKIKIKAVRADQEPDVLGPNISPDLRGEAVSGEFNNAVISIPYETVRSIGAPEELEYGVIYNGTPGSFATISLDRVSAVDNSDLTSQTLNSSDLNGSITVTVDPTVDSPSINISDNKITPRIWIDGSKYSGPTLNLSTVNETETVNLNLSGDIKSTNTSTVLLDPAAVTRIESRDDENLYSTTPILGGGGGGSDGGIGPALIIVVVFGGALLISSRD